MSFIMILLCLSCFLIAHAESNWENTVNDEGQKVQRLQIEAPAMTEEDQYGYTMPEQYRCDSCKAVVFHLNQALQQKQPKSGRLHEWEYQDLFDETCKSSFKGYGVSRVRGENVLSGPGLQKDTDLEAGMGAIQMGGETWEKRLGEICRKLVYDRIGEDEIYDMFFSSKELTQDVCYKESRECRARPKVTQTQLTSKQKDAEKQKTRRLGSSKKKTQVQEQNKVEQQTRKSKPADPPPQMAAEPVKQPALGSKETDVMDVSDFMTQLASEHDLSASEYTRPRLRQEWEKLFIRTAAKIFARQQQVASV